MAQNTVPTKNNLINTKKSLALARVGYDLMDKKRKILVREVMQRMDEAKAIRRQIAEAYADAYACLMRATVELGDCAAAARTVPTDESVRIRTYSVMGTEIPEVSAEPAPLRLYYPLSSTSAALDDAYEKFNELKPLTLRLAQTEAAVCRLADAIKKTRKRTNALGNVVIPRFELTAKSIEEVLEEREREDFTRLKVIKTAHGGD